MCQVFPVREKKIEVLFRNSSCFKGLKYLVNTYLMGLGKPQDSRPPNREKARISKHNA